MPGNYNQLCNCPKCDELGKLCEYHQSEIDEINKLSEKYRKELYNELFGTWSIVPKEKLHDEASGTIASCEACPGAKDTNEEMEDND